MPGLATTFDLLANTDNEAAAAVLLAGLDASQRDVRDLAFSALLCRRNAAAELHVLRHWTDLSDRWKTQIAERPGWLSAAIRTAVVNNDLKIYECGCSAAVFTRDYDSIPILANAASDPANPYGALAAATTLELSELLADELAAPRDYRIRRDPQLQRAHVLAALERAASSLELHGRRELLEAFLLLANRENAALKRILQAPTDRGFAPLVDLLTASSRPGIERLLLSYLDDPHAPLSAMQVIGRRADVSFLRQLVRKIGPEPAATVRSNLRRIEFIPWIVANLSVLDALREGEQPGVVHLVVGSSAPRQHTLEVVAYILRHGKVVGRRIAAQALAEFGGSVADKLALELMDDDDSDVRAAAARQLRERNVPGAIQRLVELLESSHAAEREAAQAGLIEFTWERYSTNFESLTPEARVAAGALVCRVDPRAIDNVRIELDAPTRSRRKRALEMAVALDVMAHLHPQIVSLLKDEDQFLRIDAIRTLARFDCPATRQAIRDALLDSNTLVQQAAESALAELTRADLAQFYAPAVASEASRETVILAKPFSALTSTAADVDISQPPALEGLSAEVAP